MCGTEQMMEVRINFQKIFFLATFFFVFDTCWAYNESYVHNVSISLKSLTNWPSLKIYVCSTLVYQGKELTCNADIQIYKIKHVPKSLTIQIPMAFPCSGKFYVQVRELPLDRDFGYSLPVYLIYFLF